MAEASLMPNMPSLSRERALIRAIPDFPIPGITFQDLTPLIGDGEAFASLISALQDLTRLAKGCDVIAGIEARGFIFGSALAQSLSLGFVPIRKKGKLPAATHDESYGLEYGQDVIQIHQDALSSNARVFLIDDVLATGGTVVAAIRLIERAGGNVIGGAVVMEILELMGRKRIENEFPLLPFASIFTV